MVRLPKLPAPPDPEDILSVIDKAGDAIETGLNIIDKVADKFDQAAQRFGPPEEKRTQLPRIKLPSTATTQGAEKVPEIEPQSRRPGSRASIEETGPQQEAVATACVACAVGHFSTSSGLLKEALRFKGEGMTSNEILDRIAAVLEEQNTLERVDLTPERLQKTPGWERAIAEEALTQSRQLRHKLESIQSIDEMEALAANTKLYYIKLFRQWNKGRFGYLGADKAEAIAQRVGEE